jgi:hypothetical protein
VRACRSAHGRDTASTALPSYISERAHPLETPSPASGGRLGWGGSEAWFAAALGITFRTLHDKLKKLGID